MTIIKDFSLLVFTLCLNEFVQHLVFKIEISNTGTSFWNFDKFLKRLVGHWKIKISFFCFIYGFFRSMKTWE